LILKSAALSAVKRAHVIGAKDQRTTSGPADPILRAKAEDMTAPTTYAKLKKALDQRALSRHDNAFGRHASLRDGFGLSLPLEWCSHSV
jgi:hypothetical protein